MSFPINNQTRIPQNIPSINQTQQTQQTQQAQQAQQARPAREATGIQTVVQNARTMEAQQARSAEGAQQQSEARGARGLGGRILSFICSIGRSIGNFFGIGRSHEAPPPRVRPDVEAKTEFNKGVLQSFMMKEALPEGVQAGIDQGLRLLQSSLGESFKLEGATIQDNAAMSRELCKLIAEQKRDLDTYETSMLVRTAYHTSINRVAQEETLSQTLAEIGHTSPKSMDALMQEMKATMSAQGKTLSLVGKDMTVAQFKEAHAADFKQFAEFVKTRETAQNGSLATQTMELAAKVVADKLGIPAEMAQSKVAFLTLKNTINSTIQNIQFGTTMDQLKADLNTKIEAFANKVVGSFNAVDGAKIPVSTEYYLKGQDTASKAQLSNDVRTHFKNQALSNPTLPQTVFQDSANLAGYVLRNTLGKNEYEVTMDKPLTVLPMMLKPGAEVEFNKLYSALVTLCDHLEGGLDVTCRGYGFDSGNVTYTGRASNELTAIRENALRIVMDKFPEIRDGLKANPELLDKIAEHALDAACKTPNNKNVEKNIYLNLHRLTELVRQQPSSNADLSRSISTPANLPPAHMVSFEKAKLDVSKAFPDLALDNTAFKAFDGGIAKAVLNAQQPLNAADFGATVRQAITGELAAAEMDRLLLTTNLSSESATSVRTILLANNPDLKAVSSADELKTKLDALLAKNQALIATHQTIDKTVAECKESIVMVLSHNGLVSKETLEDRMDVIASRIETTAKGLRASLKGMDEKKFPSADSIREHLEPMAKDIIEDKQNLLESVNDLTLSQDHKAKLKHVLLGSSLAIGPLVLEAVNQISENLATDKMVRIGRSALTLLNQHDASIPLTQIATSIMAKVGDWIENRMTLGRIPGAWSVSALPQEGKNLLRQVVFEAILTKEPGYRALSADAREQLQNTRALIETERGKHGYPPVACDDAIAFIDQIFAGSEAFLA